MKDAYYFSHDYNASRDPKIIKLLNKFGWLGYGMYWHIIELLHENNGSIPKDDFFDIVHYDLKMNEDELKKFIEFLIKIQLLCFNEKGNEITSLRVLRNFKKREDIKNIKSEAGKKGGRPPKKVETPKKQDESSSLTVAFQTESIENQIKGKEIKGNEMKGEIKEKKENENIKGGDILNLKDFHIDLHQHLEKWVNYMKEKHGQEFRQERLNELYHKMDKLSGGDIELSKKMIDTAIKGNYKNIFELKNGIQNGTNGITPEKRAFLNQIARTDF